MADLEGRCFVRRGRTLVPRDSAADDLLDTIGDGKEVILIVRKARSPGHHRWFFKLLRTVVQNSDDFNDEEELLDAVKHATGHVERRMMLDGSAYIAPRSINFAGMDELKFRRFVDRALFVLSRALGFDPVELMREVDAEQKAIGVKPDDLAEAGRRAA